MSHSVDDPKHFCIVMETRKILKKKTFFIEISDSKFTFFMGIWRSLNPSSCLLLACNWLKYDYGTFSQSLGVAKHVRIGLKNIKNFCWNKSFYRNFWLKFDISHGTITRKVPYVTTLSVKKSFWDLKSKIRFHSFVGLDLEYRLSTHNMVISLELKATKNQKWKKLKIPGWVPFWNNRLQVLTTYSLYV